MSAKPEGGPVPASARVRRLALQRRWRSAQAEVIVRTWRSSGLSMRAFAEQLGIHNKRLERWSARLKHDTREVAETPMRFLPVALDGQAPTTRLAVSGSDNDVMEVRLPSGATVRLRSGFDGSAFRRLLEALEC